MTQKTHKLKGIILWLALYSIQLIVQLKRKTREMEVLKETHQQTIAEITGKTRITSQEVQMLKTSAQGI